MTKFHVTYTIETDYEFPDFTHDEEKFIDWAESWIKEDFFRVAIRADNVLPEYKSHIDIEIIEDNT